MKKTLITLLAMTTCAMGASLNPDIVATGSSTITLTDVTTSVLSGGMTVVSKLNVETLKSYMKDANPPSSTLIDLSCGRSDNVTSSLGVRAYATTIDETTSSGLVGTWNGSGTYNIGMNAGVIDFTSDAFWTNVTGASLTLISKLNIGVAQGSGSTENKGTTAILTLQNTDANGISYSTYGGQWYDGLYSSSINKVNSITFDAVVERSYIYYTGVTVDAGKSLGIAMIPEPATATLSLLALAGLAARRRRK